MESVAITQVKLEAYKDVYVKSRFQDTYAASPLYGCDTALFKLGGLVL